MNWLDVSIIILVLGGSCLGMQLGLIRATFTVVGIRIGTTVVGPISDDVATYYAQYIQYETLIAVLCYVLIIAVSGTLAIIAGELVRKYASTLLFGWPDRLAGLTVGGTASIVIAAAIIIGVANLVLEPEAPSVATHETLLTKALQATEAREKLSGSLSESAIAPTVTGLTDSFPIPVSFPGF